MQSKTELFQELLELAEVEALLAESPTRIAHPNGLARSRDVASFLRMPPRTLDAMRQRGQGPPYYKVGRRILYSWNDVRTFLLKCRRSSASGGKP